MKDKLIKNPTLSQWESNDAYRITAYKLKQNNATAHIIDAYWEFSKDGVLLATTPFQKGVPVCWQIESLLFQNILNL